MSSGTKRFVFGLLAVALICALVFAAQAARTWNFDKDKVGAVPAGWVVAETSGRGTPAKWEVVADNTAPSPPNVVAITSNSNSGRTFNLLMAQGTSYKDVHISVMVKAVKGRQDQGGGPIWRAKDANNYYICRWNPLEDNFRVYYVQNGRRRQIGTTNVNVDPKKWHKIEVIHKGNQITVLLDGKHKVQVQDDTFSEPGMVGLWVKADGCSEFDDLTVEPL